MPCTASDNETPVFHEVTMKHEAPEGSVQSVFVIFACLRDFVMRRGHATLYEFGRRNAISSPLYPWPLIASTRYCLPL
jgi:hypothetical protein